MLKPAVGSICVYGGLSGYGVCVWLFYLSGYRVYVSLAIGSMPIESMASYMVSLVIGSMSVWLLGLYFLGLWPAIGFVWLWGR